MQIVNSTVTVVVESLVTLRLVRAHFNVPKTGLVKVVRQVSKLT